MDSTELAYVYRDIFESDRRGAMILDDLITRFSKPAVVKGGIDAVLQTYHREGAREVVQHIVRQINRANGVTEPNPEE